MAIDDRRRGARRTLQVARWRGDAQIAVLTPAPDRPAPDAPAVAREVQRLRAQGVAQILTGALHAGELTPFLANGFAEHEHLHLLRHGLTVLPTSTQPIRHRRATGRDLQAVLDVDVRAFDQFWTLDRRGLLDAIAATPASRYRVVGPRRARVQGYAVTGRAGDRGYLQRLAVDPEHQRAGIGRALVADALSWLKRSGARSVMVNTQDRNLAALDLYRACGFEEEPRGLTVLVLDTDGPTGP